MKCGYCSTLNKKNAKYCKSCGEKVFKKTPKKGIISLIIGGFLGFIYLISGSIFSFILLLPLILLWHKSFDGFVDIKPRTKVWISIGLILLSFFFIDSEPRQVVIDDAPDNVIQINKTEVMSIINKSTLETKGNLSLNITEKENDTTDNTQIANTTNVSVKKKTCMSKFLEKTQCQGGDAVMKEFQKTNCVVDWAFYMPCSKGCSDGACIE